VRGKLFASRRRGRGPGQDARRGEDDAPLAQPGGLMHDGRSGSKASVPGLAAPAAATHGSNGDARRLPHVTLARSPCGGGGAGGGHHCRAAGSAPFMLPVSVRRC
jgi:hypothetical protein